MRKEFHSIYSHGFLRSAVCVPEIEVANPLFNFEHTLTMARRASDAKAALAVFPELGLTGYTNEDLFQQETLLTSCLEAVSRLRSESRKLLSAIVVGAPLRFEGRLFNCALVLYRGKVLGIVPKTYLPNYREFYEKRQFCSADHAISDEVDFLGERVPFGNRLIFHASNYPGFSFFVEICEDLWSPIPPSTIGALGGAQVLLNLSASNITVGKAEYRRKLAAVQSGKCLAAYLYSAAGIGESTTDLAWDGHGMIWENGSLIAETERFSREEGFISADIDLERLTQERMRVTSFRDTALLHKGLIDGLARIEFDFEIPSGKIPLQRSIERFPYVPADFSARDERCREAYNIQVQGLSKRLKSSGIKKIVLGLSGGLDSTHALIVAAKTVDLLGLSRADILAYTMPGFATSAKTLSNAHALMKALGVRGEELDVKPSCLQMLKDIGHPFSKGRKSFDTTFENVQAGERTSHLFRLANLHDGLVLGTGDLSEAALGWCTYGVGDHMSHYNVNASVPKTLIQHLIRWVANSNEFGSKTSRVLFSILATEISPELIPGENGVSGKAIQRTEDTIGPYELQDFHLYYITRFGFVPSKVAYLCLNAWKDRKMGIWPHGITEDKRREYDMKTIKKWLSVFLRRFFGNTQFKRSCVPNGPKVGSGGSLSPRGDWRAPSDSVATVWIKELENIPE